MTISKLAKTANNMYILRFTWLFKLLKYNGVKIVKNCELQLFEFPSDCVEGAVLNRYFYSESLKIISETGFLCHLSQ